MMGAPTVSTLLRRWQALPPRQRQLFAALIVVVACVLCDAAIVRPLRAQLARLHGRIRDTEQRLTEATIASGQAEQVDQAFTAYAPYAQASGSRETEIAGVLTEVESAVREAGMVLLNLKPEGEAGTADAPALTVRVEAEASTTQLLKLLDRLQRSPRLLKVSELSVRVAEGRSLRTTMVVSKRLLAPAS